MKLGNLKLVLALAALVTVGSAGGANAAIDAYMCFDLPGCASPTPEPSTWAMMLIGFAWLGIAMRRRQKAAAKAA
jgi:hypothetical protein